MEFIPFSKANNRSDVVVVDAYLPEKLNLSHWRGVELPDFLEADTSTEIVLKALRSDSFSTDHYNFCTNNHFDIDGFLGIWALMNPQKALEISDLLIAMAAIGDFREIRLKEQEADRALSLVCKINELETSLFYPPFGRDLREAEACIPKYEYFLRTFDRLLAGEYEESSEYLTVKKQITDLENEGEVRLADGIRLLIVRAPYPMHYYPLFAASAEADIVLTIYPDQRYELEQKYTTWVQTTRRSYPRVLLADLALLLNETETNGRWEGDHFTDTGPILRLTREKLGKAERFDHPMNRMIDSSSISEDMFVEKITGFLKEKYQGVKPQVNWSWEEVRRFNAGH